MKIALNRIGGPFDYAVEGEREEEAAAELEDRLYFLSRCYHMGGESLLIEVADARRKIAEKYNVTIKSTI